MKKLNKLNKLLLTGTAAAVLGMGVAKADDFNFTAAIDILEALKVVETQKMDFGVIERPANAATVSIDKTACSGSTDANTVHIDTSTVACGIYKITGSSLKTISVDIADGDSVDGLNFTVIEGKYDGSDDVSMASGGAGLSAPTQAGKDLQLGGTLSVDPSVEEGTYAPDFNLTVNYE